MIFFETGLDGAWLIAPKKLTDERGFFARMFCSEEFAGRNLNSEFVQSSISFNPRKGILRGMHYQLHPHLETKMVRCSRGAIYDVIVDLRPESPTFLKHFGAELTAENRRTLYVPEGFAHGFQTLEDDSEVAYQISHAYVQNSAAGVRPDDPAFGIEWPLPIAVISERDRTYPDIDPASFALSAR